MGPVCDLSWVGTEYPLKPSSGQKQGCIGLFQLESQAKSVSTVSTQPLYVALPAAFDVGIPFLRIEETETASVGAIIAENSAACCHDQPLFLKSKTYSRMGVMSAVEAMTMRKAKTSTW